MAQVVIFAPAGEDVSAGEQALKDAGHEVEVVEANAENLLHMAIGMIGSDEPKEEPSEEPTEDDPLAEPAPEEEPEAEEDPKKMESVERVVTIEGEPVHTVKGAASILYVADGSVGERTTFVLNETRHAIWENIFRCNVQVEGHPSQQLKVPVAVSKFGQTYLVAGPELHDLL